MKTELEFETESQRFYKVAKANEIVQRARYDLNLQELKSLAYIISKIKPTDTELQEYTFTVNDYCRVCGIDTNNGKNIENVKKTLKGLHDKSFWVTNEKNQEVLVAWLQKVRVNKGSGRVTVRLDEDMAKYVLNLFGNFTQYELISVLPMKSAYSFRMYELLKSYAHNKSHTFAIDELKTILGAEHYTDFYDFKRKVLDISTREINLYTDINISWTKESFGRKVSHIHFKIEKLEGIELYQNTEQAINEIEGQMSLEDLIKKDVPGRTPKTT